MAFTKLHNLTEEIHTDQIGKFPIQSSAKNQYLCICYDYDSNRIIVKSIPTRKQEPWAVAETYFIKELEKRGSKPKFQRLDNEISQTVKTYMQQNRIFIGQIHQKGRYKRSRVTLSLDFVL